MTTFSNPGLAQLIQWLYDTNRAGLHWQWLETQESWQLHKVGLIEWLEQNHPDIWKEYNNEVDGIV